jgi:hypothetical protein
MTTLILQPRRHLLQLLLQKKMMQPTVMPLSLLLIRSSF